MKKQVERNKETLRRIREEARFEGSMKIAFETINTVNQAFTMLTSAYEILCTKVAIEKTLKDMYIRAFGEEAGKLQIEHSQRLQELLEVIIFTVDDLKPEIHEISAQSRKLILERMEKANDTGRLYR